MSSLELSFHYLFGKVKYTKLFKEEGRGIQHLLEQQKEISERITRENELLKLKCSLLERQNNILLSILSAHNVKEQSITPTWTFGDVLSTETDNNVHTWTFGG